ncbi:MAG TPA: hypothetical protein VMN39_06880 [Longimicrobiaceae bacterium]|nr:hypothetical protein [Longimicrobiaceae bacterium]
MSGQLESQHFFRTGDTVRDLEGRQGTVIDGTALYATIEWEFGSRAEVEQFDPRIAVVERAQHA